MVVPVLHGQGLWKGRGMEPGAPWCPAPGMEEEDGGLKPGAPVVSKWSPVSPTTPLQLPLTTLGKKSLCLRTQDAQVCVFEVLQDIGSVYFIPN